MYQGCSHGQKVSCVFGNTIGILSGDSEIFYFRRKIKTFAGHGLFKKPSLVFRRPAFSAT